MRKNILSRLALTAAFILILGSAVNGQIIPGPISDQLFDSTTTYNGLPVKIGSIIKAYDSDGVLCGIDTVKNVEGSWGYMSVYGDDPSTDSIDEGGDLDNDTLRFEINGRPATVTAGDPIFAGSMTPTPRLLSLAATGNVALTLINPPLDMLGSFNRTIRFEMQVRNDGEGTDFYGVEAISSQPGYTIEPQADTTYADAGETVTVSFDITTPIWPGNDTVNVIDFTVYSLTDPSVSVSGEVTLYFTITDVEDDTNPGLPTNFTLYQNYPNPFNPTTTISYSLPSGSKVELQILNVLGQAIETRNFGYQSAGDYEIYYDASTLATGVYFYRIVTENSTQSRKMVLMK